MDQLKFGATTVSEDMFQWISRDFNKIADELADTGYLIGNIMIENKSIKSNSKVFRMYFDASMHEPEMRKLLQDQVEKKHMKICSGNEDLVGRVIVFC